MLVYTLYKMSTNIDSFTKLDAWRKSHELVIGVFQCCDKMPGNDVLRRQIERSSLSITSNIAEGFGRQSLKDKKHFYIIARGSAYEVQNQLIVAKDTNKITKNSFDELSVISIDSLRLLHGLIRSLNNKLIPSS